MSYVTSYCAICGKPKWSNLLCPTTDLCPCLDPVIISQDIIPVVSYTLTADDKQQIRAIVAEEIAKVLSVEKIADEVVKKIAQNVKMQGGSRGW